MTERQSETATRPSAAVAQPRTKLTALLAVATVALYVVSSRQPSSSQTVEELPGFHVLTPEELQQKRRAGTAATVSRSLADAELEMQDEDIMVEILKERLKPHNLTITADGTLPPHQFLHLHHMKTGGTSVDDLLKCSVKRMQQIQHYDAKHYSLHECTSTHFRKCLEGSEACQRNLDNAALMSYCAPLKFLANFGWIEPAADGERPAAPKFGSLSVLRHPAERVWSNYRFATKGCYKCNELKDVYKAYDAGKLESIGMRNESLCVRQMLNHETFNLLSSKKFEKAREGMVEVPQEEYDEMVEEAVYNMKNFFTMIGITEELDTFGKMIPMVFPFMSPTIPGSHRACHLPHSNKSPRNNGCGPNRSHWDLPAHPDEETRKLIEEHNQMDMKLYEAAVAHFQLQKKALGLA